MTLNYSTFITVEVFHWGVRYHSYRCGSAPAAKFRLIHQNFLGYEIPKDLQRI